MIEIFRRSRDNYGTRKIKVELKKEGIRTSRKRISRIIRHEGLVSKYTVAQYKPIKSTCNEKRQLICFRGTSTTGHTGMQW